MPGGKRAKRTSLLWNTAHDQSDFVFQIDAGEVIVFFVIDAVAAKNTLVGK